MANIWLPGDSDLALALREPNLLVPGRKPAGPLRMRDVRVRTQDVGDTGTPRPQFALLDRYDLVNGRYVAQSSRTDYADGSFFATLNDADCDGLESHDSENHTWCFHFKTQASVIGYLLAKTDESAGNRVLRFSLSSATNLQCLIGDPTGNWANFNLTLPVTLQPHTEYFLTIRETGNETGITGWKREVFVNRQATLTSENGTTEDFTYKNTTADWTLGSSNIPVFAFVKYDVSLTDQQVYSIHDDFYGFHFEPANSALFLIRVAGGGAVDLTPAVETDSAIALSVAKSSTLGVSSETDTAVALTSEKRADLGAAVEADSAQLLDYQKVAALSPALETDAAQAISYGMSVTLGVAIEADTAPSLSASKHAALGTAAETDAAVALSTAQGASLGAAVETDAAQALSTERHTALGVAQEIDAAVSLTYGNTASLNPALETDSANAITYRKVAALGSATETDQAQNLATAKVSSIGVAGETDSALPLVPSTGVSLSPATETDTALAISGQRISTLGAATELDLAVALAWDVVQPGVDIFQSAADVLINALGKARAQTIVLSLESGAVRLEDDDGNPTAYMRKRPNDWNTPDGRMTGSGWQIVCKGWEIADSDIESISGRTATIAGEQYYVVAATPRTSGSLVLDLGYANT